MMGNNQAFVVYLFPLFTAYARLALVEGKASTEYNTELIHAYQEPIFGSVLAKYLIHGRMFTTIDISCHADAECGSF